MKTTTGQAFRLGAGTVASISETNYKYLLNEQVGAGIFEVQFMPY